MKYRVKKTFAFRLFYYFRALFWSDDKIKTQFLKRAHLLEKANQNRQNNSILNFEVNFLFSQLVRRGVTADDSIRWARDVLFDANFHLKPKETASVKYSSQEIKIIEQAIKSRRSIRKWNNKPVKIEDIIQAIDSAKWAPNSCNRQGWFFLIVSKKTDFKYIQNLTNQDFFVKAKVLIVAMIDRSKYNQNETIYSYLDVGAAIQNLLLSLHSRGYGACWLGLKESPNFKNSINQFRQHFKIDKSLVPISFLAIGNYEKKPNSPLRKDTKEIYKNAK